VRVLNALRGAGGLATAARVVVGGRPHRPVTSLFLLSVLCMSVGPVWSGCG
jgi:hypothetical protein